MNSRSIILVLALLSIPLVYSVAFASSSAELTRTSNIQVDTDANGLITLTPNPSYEIIQVNQQMSIDPAHVGADSINENATLTLGNPQDPSATEAFTIQNASGDPVSLDISLQGTGSYTGDANSIVYYVDQNGTVTEVNVGSTRSFQLNDGEEIYVAVEMSSVGTSGDLSTDLIITGGTP